MSNPFNLPPDKARRLAALIRRVAADPRYDHFDNVRKIVGGMGKEPKPGKTADKLSVDLSDAVQVSVEGRRRNASIPIVRVDGQIVLHGYYGTYEPGEWERTVEEAAKGIDSESQIVVE